MESEGCNPLMKFAWPRRAYSPSVQQLNFALDLAKSLDVALIIQLFVLVPLPFIYLDPGKYIHI